MNTELVIMALSNALVLVITLQPDDGGRIGDPRRPDMDIPLGRAENAGVYPSGIRGGGEAPGRCAERKAGEGNMIISDQMQKDAFNSHLAAQELGNCCSNCGKRGEPTCCEYKENGRRPGDGDWCYGWRERRVAQWMDGDGKAMGLAYREIIPRRF